MTVGLEPVVRILNQRDSPPERSLVSDEKAADMYTSPAISDSGSDINDKKEFHPQGVESFLWSVLDSNQ